MRNRSRVAAYSKIGVALSGDESLEEATEKIYPNVLIECDLHAKLEGEFNPVKVSDKKAIYKDNGEYISTVGSGYGLVQPFESIQYMQSYLDTSELKLTHGGQLDGGRKMFLMSDIWKAETEIAKGDAVKCSLLSSTSFDGSSKNRIDIIITRLACLNGMKVDEKVFSVGFKHTSKIHQRLDAAKHEIQIAVDAFYKTTNKMKVLATKKVTEQQVKTFVRNVFVSEEAEDISTRTNNQIERVLELVYAGAGNDNQAIQGTAWQAFNGVTEYVTHEYGRNEESRLEAQWFGASADINRRAMSLAMSM